MGQGWHAVNLKVPRDDVEMAAHLLHELGCNGVVEEEAPDAVRVHLIAYFDAARDPLDRLAERVRSAFAPCTPLASVAIEVVAVAANEWAQRWRQWFSPFAIVPGIVVAPSWEHYEPKEGESVITLDPGMAFGTGLHQTTALCAEAMHALIQPPLTLPSLLDVGTGSGLLAIVGRRLDAGKIAAVESDPEALRAAKENFAVNGMAEVTAVPSLDDISGPFDLVVANILLLTLLELRDRLIARCAPGGRLILSGITRDQEERIRRAFSPPLSLSQTTRRDEWSCMVFAHGST